MIGLKLGDFSVTKIFGSAIAYSMALKAQKKKEDKKKKK
jgi:ribosomal protein S19